jgi:energy-coupling factor transport system permease protein
MRLVPTYRQRPSALHSARAGAAAAFCCSLALPGVLFEQPLVLLAALTGIVVAGIAARVGREVGRALLLSVPLALMIALVNPLVYQEGETVLLRGWEVLGLGPNITLEALAAGLIAGLRVTVVIAALGLLSAAVDPDDVLRLFRRVSYRSALTAALATRLVPVLARDAGRMGDAAKCRPRPAARLAVARATVSGALDRAVEVAAALEVRGYALAGRPGRGERPPWSRHDRRVAACAALISAGCIALAIAGGGRVEMYPALEAAPGTGDAILAACLLLLSAAPFAGRAARLGVARA